MQIPGYLEQKIFEGKAKAKIYSGGLDMQMVIKVPANSYIVIYGYYFRPYMPNYGDTVPGTGGLTPVIDCRAGVQYVLFKTNNDFYPYAHQGQPLSIGTPIAAGYTSPIGVNERKFCPNVLHEARSTYMVSNTDVGISIAYINGTAINQIPGTVASNTQTLPPNLQYGGESIDIAASGYFDPVLTGFYYPLNEPYTEQSGLPPTNVTNYQIWPRPSSGTIPLPTNINSGDALFNAKWPLITVLYVQFNESMPENLK